ncbi:uroporphyrinogen-III synthase [Devosia sp. XJ19-1]|uniref:Uroporphyrinogen-III synthase n=1 Tax=Devosia ureilytica TaxID=2952754 RepID=A0A9Q4FS41_9HYPH|nr:uroporphyrinogen-III synthase [Devosia ureilytica]MCP8882824.1 uroporphyrinogen-III synthase [Devosia ureilytica]MCP8886808.1 uroporphyrinogen-III synthase [Devosia ureilytica]
MRMLITRPEPDAQATRDRLAALDIAADIAPLMTRQNLPGHLPPPDGFAAVALTSTNALRALSETASLEPLFDKPVFAVGDRTAHEARQLGFARVTAADGTLESLATTIALARVGGPVFYPAGKHLSGDLAHALAPHGLMVVTVPVYEMVAETALAADAIAGLAASAFGAVLFYSRRTAEIFCTLVADVIAPADRRNLPVICLSENVAAPLLNHHFSRVLLADHPSEEAMLALSLAFAREQTGS